MTFVSFDLETTGLTDKDKIIEFGAARVEKNQIRETFQTLINPETHIPLDIFILTGIKEDDIKKAPRIDDVKNAILDFIGSFPLVAHNAPFDISFLNREVYEIGNPVFDTLELSRIVLPFIINHKLMTLHSFFEEEESNYHRALDDAIATSKVFLKLRALIEKLPLETLKKILSIVEKIKGGTASLFKIALNNALSDKGRRDMANLRDFFQIPYNVLELDSTKKTTPLPPTEKSVEEILTNDETFNKAVSKYEKRVEQIELSKMVMRSFLYNEILVSEAGTGTGKTFAYLIPSMLWSNSSNERILISTYTKNLEDQLFHKDIINISEGLSVKFKAALIKGRKNYLCLKRWDDMFSVNFTSLNKDEKKSLPNLVIWQELTKTGDISENSSFWLHDNLSLWSKLSCDAMDCEMNKCPYFHECYLTRIRREAQEANIVVINHSLLFSDLNAEQKILGEYNRLIIDEAHNLEKAATDFLGTTVTSWQIKNVLDRLYKREKGLFVRMRNIITVIGKKIKNIPLDDLTKCIVSVDKAKTLLMEISQRIADEVEKSEYSGKLRLKEGDSLVEEIKPLNEAFCSHLKDIYSLLKRFIKIFEDEKDLSTWKEIVEEVTEVYKESEEIVENFYNILSCEDKNNCFWVESSNESENIKLVSAPIVVADILREKLFDNLETAVLVSATVLVENSFDYIKEKVGLAGTGRVKEFATGSSFDFENQVLALLPSFISDPQRNGFFMDVVDVLRKVILLTRRGTLILFTSYKFLNKSFEHLIETLHQNNILLLAQGRSGSKNVIIKEFKEIKDSVLLGTYSFWEGFDVPGEALETLIITKLPFPSPKEPIIEARTEYIESQGLRPFEKLYIPEAVIKLRQGFGRLIRTKGDRGIIIILDTRLIKREYGERFLHSLPTNIEISYREGDFLERIRKFWEE